MNFRNYYNSYRINVAFPQSDKIRISSVVTFFLIALVMTLINGTNNFFMVFFTFSVILPAIKKSSFISPPTVRSTLPIKTSKRILYSYLTLLVTICMIIAIAIAFFSFMFLLNIIFSSNLDLAQEFNDFKEVFPFSSSAYKLSMLFNVVLLYYPLNFIRKAKNIYIVFTTSTAFLLGYNCMVRHILKLKISTRILSKEEVLSLENPSSVFMYALIFLGIIAILSFIFCAFIVKKTRQRQYI